MYARMSEKQADLLEIAFESKSSFLTSIRYYSIPACVHTTTNRKGERRNTAQAAHPTPPIPCSPFEPERKAWQTEGGEESKEAED